MPDRGLKPGFTFPMKEGRSGLSCKSFGVTKTDQGHAVPLGNNAVILRRTLPFSRGGICRLEVFPENVNAMTADADDALFVAHNIEIVQGTTESQPEPFLILAARQGEHLADDLETFKGQSIHLRFTPMAEVKIKQPDPWNKGWTLGWGVYRLEPWDFRGLYNTEEEARATAKELGADYEVAYGSNRDGTDDFVV